MSGEIFLADALHQLEAFVFHVSAMKQDPAQHVSPPKDPKSMDHYRRISSLPEADAWACLHQIQMWLAR